MKKEPEHNRVRAEFYSHKYNRSFNQIMVLLDLVGYEYEFYEALEIAIYNNGIFHCPSTMVEIKSILDMRPRTDRIKPKKSNHRITFNSPCLLSIPTIGQAITYSRKSGYNYFLYLGKIHHISGEDTGIAEDNNFIRPDIGWDKVFNSYLLHQLKEPKENEEDQLPAFQKAIAMSIDNGYGYFNWRNHLVYSVDGKPTGILIETLN